MTKPKRVQRKRTKGYKLPPNTVYVGRPTKWGNPWDAKEYGTEYAVACYGMWITGRYLERDDLPEPPEDFEELHGKDLACWCPLDQSCHADVLLELAND